MAWFIVIVGCAISVPYDLVEGRIPNWLTGTCGFLLVADHVLRGDLLSMTVWVPILALTLPLVALAVWRPDGFGMGDAKLACVVVSGLGWGGLPAIFAGFAFAAVAGLGLRWARGSETLPLAPFLTAGVLAASAPL